MYITYLSPPFRFLRKVQRLVLFQSKQQQREQQCPSHPTQNTNIPISCTQEGDRTCHDISCTWLCEHLICINAENQAGLATLQLGSHWGEEGSPCSLFGPLPYKFKWWGKVLVPSSKSTQTDGQKAGGEKVLWGCFNLRAVCDPCGCNCTTFRVASPQAIGRRSWNQQHATWWCRFPDPEATSPCHGML